MKTVKALIQTTNDRAMGNHAVTIFRDRLTPYAILSRNFTYHGNVICHVNDVDKTFETSHCGWHTSSTSRAINSYKYELTSRGYTCIKED